MATSFALTVPHNPAGTAPISRVKLTLSLESEALLSLQITDPGGVAHTFAPAVPAVGAATSSASFDYPLVGGASDFVLVQRESGSSAADPVRRTCVVFLTLNTDVDTTICSSNAPGTLDTWQFSVVAGPEISGVCQISITPDPAAGCTGAVNLPSSTPLAQLAQVNGEADQGCGLQRSTRPAHIELVLDRSGSMFANSTLVGLPLVTTRMEALHAAVQNFVSVWDALDVAGDRVGVVTFDHLPPEEPFGAGLQDFAAASAGISAGIAAVTPRGATSIGAGLIKGVKAFDANNDNLPDTADRKVVLLMSDGQQNTDPMVGVDIPTNRVFTFNQVTPAIQTNLPLLGSYQVYNVTIGPDVAVEPAIKYHMANVTGGYYINTETDGNLLTPFFIDLLGSFVHFTSWETARLIRAEVTPNSSFTTDLFLATTTQAVVVNLAWDQRLGILRLSVIAPDGKQAGDVIIDRERGMAKVSFDPTGRLSASQPWKLQVELGELSGLGKELGGRIPFDLAVLVEDVAIGSTLRAMPQDYRPGDTIQLEIQLREFGLPITGVGANPGDQVVVQVVRPGASIGDILSDGRGMTHPPSNDPGSAAQNKLSNMLEQNPELFRRNEDNPDLVVLTQAEPGIYRGTFVAPVTGHYNFLFGVSGNASETGRFSRQAIRTVYVRAVPSVDTTDVQTSVSASILNIGVTPRTRGRDRMGPGWGNHFWLTAPGVQPFKLSDNLNGTYSARLSFSGNTLPPVTLHFVDVLQSLGDEVTADRLPIQLGERTSLIATLPGTGGTEGGDSLRGCLVQVVRLLVMIVRLVLQALERLLRGLGG